MVLFTKRVIIIYISSKYKRIKKKKLKELRLSLCTRTQAAVVFNSCNYNLPLLSFRQPISFSLCNTYGKLLRHNNGLAINE